MELKIAFYKSQTRAKIHDNLVCKVLILSSELTFEKIFLRCEITYTDLTFGKIYRSKLKACIMTGP